MLPKKSVHTLWYLLIALLCMHVFFINIKSSHDWGDDFAQYIHQAKNITNGISQMETGFIFNKEFPLYSPPAYFMGFPLLLAPVYAVAGNDIKTFSFLISTFLFLSALVFFRFFNSYISTFSSLLLVLIILYNPWILNFKMGIASDIPFTFFLFLGALQYLTSKKTFSSLVITGLITGFLVSIRTIGVSFIIAVILNEVLAFKRGGLKNKKQLFQRVIIFLLVSMGFFVIINHVIFDIPFLNFKSSGSLFAFNDLYETILKNINYYFDTFQSAFNTQPENTYALFSTLIKSIILSLMLLGFYLRTRRGMEFIDILLIIYMAILYVYPYSSAGFRFLIPVAPILLLYSAEGLYFLMTSLQWKRSIIYCLCIVAFLAVYKYEWKNILDRENIIELGPRRMDAQAAFDFINTHTEKNARILFKKPRALALYTDRNCFINNPENDLQNQLRTYNIGYILINEEISDDSVKNFVAKNPAELQLLWNNDSFRFYRISHL